MVHKNEDCSQSVSSIDSGAIFPPPLGEDLSRNAFVVSILFPERISSTDKDFFMHPKSEIFHHFSKFLQECQEASRELLGAS